MTKLKEMKLTASVERDSDGSYWAQIKELPGCFASGFTMDELIEGLQDAIRVYLGKEDGSVAETRVDAETPGSIRVDELTVLV